MSQKIAAGSAMPAFSLPKVGGGEVTIGGPGRWQLVVVYRGKHCPICNRYLTSLEELQGGFAEKETEVVAISGDPAEKASAQIGDLGLTLPVGHSLSVAQMRELGLYVSEPRSAEETDRPFAEPGTFLVNPEGQVQIVDISNAPFSRPDLAGLLRGIGVIQERNYPVRGTA